PLAGRCIERVGLRPRGRDVDLAVDRERCRFLRQVGVEIGVPGESEPADAGGVDLRQRAPALFAVRAAVRRPVGLAPLRQQRRVDLPGTAPVRAGGGEQNQRRDCSQADAPHAPRPSSALSSFARLITYWRTPSIRSRLSEGAKLTMPLSLSAPSWTIAIQLSRLSSAALRRKSGSTVAPTAASLWHWLQ